MITIDGRVIRILLKGDRELRFDYESEEELRESLRVWAKSGAVTSLSNQAPAQFSPDSKYGQTLKPPSQE
jgi:hypothetical protein